MSLVRNEQTKLTATYFNGLAIAVAAIGGIAPVLAYALGSTTRPLWIVASAAAICVLVSSVLHFFARRILRNLIP